MHIIPSQTYAITPIELLSKAAQYDSRNDLVTTIITRCNLSKVCKELESTVKNSWSLFIQQAGKVAFYLDEFPEMINFSDASEESLQNALSFIKGRFHILKRWQDITPIVSYTRLQGHDNILQKCDQQAVLNNHLGIPELWAIDNDYQNLVRVDLETQNYSVLELEEKLNLDYMPIHLTIDNKWISISEKWIASITYSEKEDRNEIWIIDICSGSCLHKISTIKELIEFHCDEERLYVLEEKDSEQPMLLIYDSKNWKETPKTIPLPNDIENVEFYLGKSALLFSGTKYTENKYEIYVYLVNKEDCFSNSDPSFFKAEMENEYPLVKVINDRFITLSPRDPDPGSNYYKLKSLSIEHSSLIEEDLQEILRPRCGVEEDFQVVSNTIITFVASYPFLHYPDAISFFNLTDGILIRNVDLELKNPSYFMPTTLIKLPNNNLAFIHQALVDPIEQLHETMMIELEFEPEMKKLGLSQILDDLLLKIIGDPGRLCPIEGLERLLTLRLVCKNLKDKVDRCWLNFIRHIGKYEELKPSHSNIDFANFTEETFAIARNFAFLQARIYKKTFLAKESAVTYTMPKKWPLVKCILPWNDPSEVWSFNKAYKF